MALRPPSRAQTPELRESSKLPDNASRDNIKVSVRIRPLRYVQQQQGLGWAMQGALFQQQRCQQQQQRVVAAISRIVLWLGPFSVAFEQLIGLVCQLTL